MEKSNRNLITIPKCPSKADRVDCFLKVDGVKKSFWVDSKCTPNRIKNCLLDVDGMDPFTTTLRLDGKKLTKEMPLISYYGLKSGDIICVRYVKLNRVIISQLKKELNENTELFEKKFYSEECVSCFDTLDHKDPCNFIFVPCGHACVCRECIGKFVNCPICNRLNE